MLDTQVVLWTLVTPMKIGAYARALIADGANEIFVSSISIVEVAIKFPLRKRQSAPPFNAETTLALCRDTGFLILPLTAAHAVEMENLPSGMHGDPFDRLLLAQARSEGLRLVSADRALRSIDGQVIPA